jgi:hypothetical protein
LRRSGGTRFCTSLSASRPAITAWLMRLPRPPDRREEVLLDDELLEDDDARFLLAMPCPPL